VVKAGDRGARLARRENVIGWKSDRRSRMGQGTIYSIQ